MPLAKRNTIPAVVLNDTRVDLHHGCSRVMTALGGLVARNGLEVIGWSPAHSDWKNNDSLLAQLERARIVIVNGEGTLHHDRPAGQQLLDVGTYAKSLGLPAVLINAGWEANGPAMLARLDDFALVAVRDSISAAQIRLAGYSCRVVPDLSLYGSSSEEADVRRGIAFTDSVDRTAATLLERVRRRTGSTPLAIHSLNDRSKDRYRFVRAGFAARDVFRPVFASRMLQVRLAQYGARVASPQDLLRRLATLELLVSGRFHACALALVARTPFIAVPSNTRKIAALVEDAGLQPWRATAGLDLEEIESARATGWLPEELDARNEYLFDARRKAEALFEDIRRLV